MRIVVTRADAQADELVEGIEGLGHEAVRWLFAGPLSARRMPPILVSAPLAIRSR